MKLSKLILDSNLKLNFKQDFEIEGVSNNSLNIKQGFVFVLSVKDEARAKRYTEDAIARGAVLVVNGISEEYGLVYEGDLGECYSKLVAAFFGNPQKRLKMIGVTGTNGKTSTCKLIYSMLNDMGIKTGVIGTIANEFLGLKYKSYHTTPDSDRLFFLLSEMLKKGCTHCVMEVSSHSLVQGRVSAIEFDVAVFTNLTQDHLDYHVTMEEYARAKSKLFSMAKTAVINIDSLYYKKMVHSFKGEIITYSLENNNADYYCKNPNYTINGTAFDILHNNTKKRIETSLIGKFNIYNTIAAICAIIKVTEKLDTAINSLKSFEGVAGRAEIIYSDKYTIIRDYAHTPDAIEKLLTTLRPLVKGRLVALFGCGGDRDKTKRSIMGKIATVNSDVAIVTSDNPRSENPMDIIRDIKAGVLEQDCEVITIPDRLTAIKYAVGALNNEDTLVLLGKGHEDYQVLKDKIIHFDEKEIIENILKNIDGE